MNRYKFLLIALLLAALCLISIGASNTDWTAFIEYGGCSGASNGAVGDNGGHEYGWAQKITLDGGYIRDIQIKFGSPNGSPSGVVHWELDQDVAGEPVTPSMRSGNLLAQKEPGWYGTGHLNLNGYDGLAWIYVFADSQSTNNRWNIGVTSSDCNTNFGRYQFTDGVIGVLSTYEVYVRVYEDYFTPTATLNIPTAGPTEGPTMTPTVTPTPLPPIGYTATLDNGAYYQIDRYATFGDISVFILLAVIVGLLVIIIILEVIRVARAHR